ncbi:hypothetical protein [Mesorhizobium shangrilense]|uniref:Uncharacterized protein n=1 Tax=Mesorhizobium shangrilense TaxID=460060 RepID=A0ABV2DH01_9HYPH
MAVFVSVTSIEALAYTAVLNAPEKLSKQAIEALVEEAIRLVVGYLR